MPGGIRAWWRFRQTVRKTSPSIDAEALRNKDVLVLPCWRRPEFLWHCLDNIARADDIGNLKLHIRPDTGFAPENLDVIRSFAERLPDIEVHYPTPSIFRRTKQSANVLLGYLSAAAQSRQFVYLVEEDVMVARDFFRWHREVHSVVAGNLFCSIASSNPNRRLELPENIEDFYLSSGDFCSIGVCFDRRVLQSMLGLHVNMRYLRRPKNYIRTHFPASGIGLGFVEQDGLIRRIQERSTRPIAWACVPRAFHAGFYGYNRPGEIAGDLQQRIASLSHTIYDPAAMHEADSIPSELQLPRWSSLRQVDVPPP